MFKTGRYEIVGELGRGSMGVVYEGYDPLIHRRVAIKTMRIEGLSTREYEQYKARFQAEAQAAGVLEHPNIVTIHDFGEDNGILYLAMEFLKGKSLRQIVDEKGNLPVETVIPIFQQVSSALDHAHAHHIIHRDIKPANIMVLESGLVKVTDFGIAKVLSTETGMTYAGQILGTPNYMSPEQVKGERVDGRSDLFALGVILYELVTGQKPFGGQNVTTVMYKIINEQPASPLEVDPAIHPGLARVINRALAKRPEDRYQACRELADDLTNYKNLVKAPSPSETVVTQRPSLVASQSTVRPIEVRRFPVIGAAVATLIVVAGLAGGYYLRSRQHGVVTRLSIPPTNTQTATPGAPTPPAATPPSAAKSSPNPDGELPAGKASSNASAQQVAAPESKVLAAGPKEASMPDSATKSRSLIKNVGSSSSAGVHTLPLSPTREVSDSRSRSSLPPPGDSAAAKKEAPLPTSTPVAQVEQAVQQPSALPPQGSVTNATIPAELSAPGTEYVLETDPTGVDVFIDGKLWGRTDKEKPVIANLSVGDHTLILKYRGVKVLERQIKKTPDAQWQKWKLPISEPVP